MPGLRDLDAQCGVVYRPIEPNDILGMSAMNDGIGSWCGLTHMQGAASNRMGRCYGRLANSGVPGEIG
jgi:hypothetical protein